MIARCVKVPASMKISQNQKRSQKRMKMEVNTKEKKEIVIPTGKLADSDWFKCESCGYTVRMLVLGDRATCSQCGGQMVRI